MSAVYIVTLLATNDERNSIHGLHATLKCAARRGLRTINARELQHGVPLATIRHALLRDSRGVAESPLGAALDRLTEFPTTKPAMGASEGSNLK
jgi:hypothetical protein